MDRDDVLVFGLVVIALSSIAIVEALIIYKYQEDTKILRRNQEVLLDHNERLIGYAENCSEHVYGLYVNISLSKKQLYEVQSQVNYWKGRAENMENFIYHDVQEYCDEQLPSFVEVARNVSRSHLYDIEEYNCVDFTAEFNDRMEEQGIAARQYDVIMECPPEWPLAKKQEYCMEFDGEWKVGHAISMLRVFVDATAGVFIEPDDYEEWGLA